jgi:hypothetical protein
MRHFPRIALFCLLFSPLALWAEEGDFRVSQDPAPATSPGAPDTAAGPTAKASSRHQARQHPTRKRSSKHKKKSRPRKPRPQPQP